MGRRVIDLSRQRFGFLFAIEPDGRDKSNHMTWRCVCDCGRQTVVRSAHLQNGEVTSCGGDGCRRRCRG